MNVKIKNILSITKRAGFNLIEGVVLLILILMFSLQSYWVQSFFARQLTNYLSSELDAEVSVGSVKVNGFNYIELNAILIRDLNRDTLAYFPSISIDVDHINWKTKSASVKEIVFNEALFNFYVENEKDEMNLKFILDYFSKEDVSKEKSAYNVDIQNIDFINCRFIYNDYNIPENPDLFDINHLDLSELNVIFKELNTANQDFLLRINDLSLKDKSGFKLSRFNSSLFLNDTEIQLDSTLISTPNSSVFSSLIALNYTDISDLNDFINKVDIDTKVELSNIGLNDFSFFSSSIQKSNQNINLSGEVRGKIHELNIDNLYIEKSENLYVRSDLKIKGLPEFDSLILDVKVYEGLTSKEEFDKINFLDFGLNTSFKLPYIIDEFGLIDVNGSFIGSFKDFNSKFLVNTEIGSLDGSFNAVKDINQFSYDGQFDLRELNLRKLIDDNNFSTLNGNFKLNGRGFSIEHVDVSIDGELTDFIYQGYSYEDVVVKGDLKEKSFIGTLNVIDSNINLNFDGNFDLTQYPVLFDFNVDLINANLAHLNLLNSRGNSSIGFNLYASGFGSNLDDFSGMVDVRNINYIENGTNYYFDSIQFDSQSNDYFHSISFHSKMAEFELSGQYHINTMIQDIYTMGSAIFPSILPPDKNVKLSKENFVMNAKVNDLSKLSYLFFPDIGVSPNTSLHCEYNSINQMLDIKAHSDWLNFNGLSLNNLNIDTTKRQVKDVDTSYVLNLSVENINYDSIIDIQNLNLESNAFSDNFEIKMNWINEDSTNLGHLSSYGKLSGDGSFDLFLQPAEFYSSKTGDWIIEDTTHLDFQMDEVHVNELIINNGDQKIFIDGFLSKDPNKELKINIDEISLNNLNSLFGIDEFELNGSFNLSSTVKDIYNEVLFNVDAFVYGIKLNDYLLGDLSLRSIWDSEFSRINMYGGLMNEQHNEEIKIYDSYYNPDFSIEDQLDLHILFNDFDIDFANAFLPEDVLSKMSGKLKGVLKTDGSWTKPELNGEIKLIDGEITLDEFNTDYYFGGDLIFSPNEIAVNQIPIYDKYNSEGKLSAFFIHNNFINYSYNIIGSFAEPFLLMNTDYEMNPLYYGDAYVTGTTNITYDSINDLDINVDVKTEDNTFFTLPLYGAEDVVLKDFISFKTNEIIKEEIYEVNLDGISLSLNIDLTEDAEFELVFDEVVGDAIKARGEGQVDLLIDQFYNFSMFGKYTLSEGEYLFTLKDFINKKFMIEPGGEISWYGDPYNADIDISTVYPLKTSLYSIMPIDQKEEFKQKTDVNVNMHLKNNLFNPDISFGIDLPRSNEDAKTAVNSLVSTEQGMNKQVFSLLILNKFMTSSVQDGVAALKSNSGAGSSDVLSNVETATNEVLSNVGSATSEVLSNQLSNMISKFSDDFELGFNYTPGDVISNDEVTVAMSTQQFNDRLHISTNLGVSQGNKMNKNPSSFIGDVDVEYKLNSQGNLRVHAFNKSNEYDMTNLNQSNYTQGLGTFYKQSFNNFGELFCEMKNIFKSKANKCKNCVSKEGRNDCK